MDSFGQHGRDRMGFWGRRCGTSGSRRLVSVKVWGRTIRQHLYRCSYNRARLAMPSQRALPPSSADWRQCVSVRVTSTDVGIERAIVRVESADFGVETVNVRVQNADFGVKSVNVHVKNVHFSRTVIMSSVGQVTGQRRIAPLYRSFREPPDIQRGLFRRKAPF